MGITENFFSSEVGSVFEIVNKMEESQSNPSIFQKLFNIFMVHAEEVKKQELNSCYHDTSRKILIGGGTGFIGTELCKTLKKKGYTPIIVSRAPGPSRLTYTNLESNGLPVNTTAIVNLAGQNVLDFFHRWTGTFKSQVYDSRINTAKAFKEVIEKSDEEKRPKVFVQITGIGYFPPRDDGLIYNEDSIVEESQRDFFSKLVVDWENAAKLSPDLGVRNVFIRPGVVLGRKGGMISQIFLPFYLGGGGRMGSGDQPMSWIHVKDVCGIILHAIENDNVDGVLNAVAPQKITNQDFVNAFASALNRPAFFPLPDFVWNLVFGQERATMITKGQKVQPKRTLESGYEFQFPNITKACEEFSALFYTDE